MISKRQLAKVMLAAALAGVVGTVSAQQMGPGMMGPGYGNMGPGMMGPGYGNMGPGMMGPGYGNMGPGMMGPGYGNIGPGMSPDGYYGLDLSEDQQSKIAAIQKQARKDQWNIMGQIRDEQFKLQELYYARQPDPAAINAEASKIEQLQRKLIQANIDAQKQMESVLTPEQREQLQRWYRSSMMQGY